MAVDYIKYWAPSDVRISKMTWDGMAELVSRDQVLRRERGQNREKIFSFFLGRVGNLTRLNKTLLL